MSSTTEYIISKEGKEFKNARSWMQENGDDPFFNVCTHYHLTSLPKINSPTLGLFLEAESTSTLQIISAGNPAHQSGYA